MSKMIDLREVGDRLGEADDLVLCCHVGPDGDTLGSALGLSHFLKQQGKQVTLFVDDEINSYYSFLPGIEAVKRPQIGSEKINTDILLVLDASSIDRIGNVMQCVNAKAFMNIDHHISNTRFAEYLYLDTEAAATGEIMCDLFDVMDWDMDVETATCFYTAISTDCGSFRYANTTGKTMRRAAALLEKGVKQDEIADFLEVTSRESMCLLSDVLPSLTFAFDNRVAYMSITEKQYDKNIFTDSFVSYPRRIEGVEVAIMFKAVEAEVIRVSMRSKGADVSEIALSFGGGGHVRAAGCTIYAPLAEARKQLLERLGKIL